MQIINIRNGDVNDLAELQQLFRDCVVNVCSVDYDEEQIRVWAAGIENAERWLLMLAQQFVLVAEIKNAVVGFITLDKSSHIDMLYVHKDYQRAGIARLLYEGLEAEALRRKQVRLTADVSKTARPFFTSQGFKVLTEQVVLRQGVALRNFSMEKTLPAI